MIDQGYYFSLGSDISIESKIPEIPLEAWFSFQKIVCEVPSDQLVVESDGPHRVNLTTSQNTSRALPNFILEVYSKIAEIKQITKNELVQITTNNILRLFKNHPSLVQCSSFIASKSSL